ncbi:MAG: hypothetical protein Kow0025_02440 [Thermodesulfovibrionales bacterium]
MKRLTLAVATLAALAAVAGYLASGGKASVPEASAAGYETQSSGSMSDGDVVLELAPRGVEDGRLVVDFAMNTHSVRLSDFDLAKLSTLHLAGRDVKPSRVTPPAGHHAYGQMVFDTGEAVGDFTITVEGIPLEEKRVYAWKGTGGR